MKIDYKVYILNKNEKIKYYGFTTIVALALSYLLYDNLIFAILFVPVVIFCKKIYSNKLLQDRKKALMLEFKDFLYLISTSFSLGRNMQQAIGESITSLITVYGEKSLLAFELNEILIEMENTNGSEQELLKDFAKRSGSEDVSDFVQVYESCKTTGGDIIEGINNASSIIADKITIEEEIKASSAQKKLEGRLISLAPFIIILFLKLTSPDYISVMYNTLPGRIIMTMTFLAAVFSVIITERITKVEI